MGITFNNVTFLFEIDHDDGTVKYFLSHFLDRYEPCIDQDLIYRHRATTSMNYKPLYCSIIFISLVEAHLIFIDISKKNIIYEHVHRKVPIA